jgi:deoxyribose-phosphate aldolase
VTVVPSTRAELAALVDHTLLRPEASANDVRRLCAEAVELGVFSVCVSPTFVALASQELEGADVAVASVVGFPSGAHSSEVKAFEAARAVGAGAQELDMVIDLGLAVAGDWGGVQQDIVTVRMAAPAAVLKVIIESAALDLVGVRAACVAAEEAGADFVKTSTGFHPAGGASLDAVRAMSETVGDRLGVKASGGIRSTQDARAMVAAGANRLGLSGTRAVLDGFR